MPLAEARLSTFLAADRDRTEDAPEAFLAGSIEDAQSRYNLRNLVEGDKVVPAELDTLRRLFEAVQASPQGADRVASALLQALSAGQPGKSWEGAPLMPKDAAQLRWLGVDSDTLGKLLPFVVLLPTQTSVNLNTAPREVIAAVIPGLDLAVAERVVQSRARSPLRGIDEVEGAAAPGRDAGYRARQLRVELLRGSGPAAHR